MKVLIACEESQAVCKEFRSLGHEAYSCDIQECSGGHPEWHVNDDVLPLLNGNCSFKTENGDQHLICGGGGRMGKENYRGQQFASGSRNRSKTFPGVAKAMAEQWSSL